MTGASARGALEISPWEGVRLRVGARVRVRVGVRITVRVRVRVRVGVRDSYVHLGGGVEVVRGEAGDADAYVVHGAHLVRVGVGVGVRVRVRVRVRVKGKGKS